MYTLLKVQTHRVYLFFEKKERDLIVLFNFYFTSFHVQIFEEIIAQFLTFNGSRNFQHLNS